jgi:6,7-dimethyl-8-ribityllumazine synthase
MLHRITLVWDITARVRGNEDGTNVTSGARRDQRSWEGECVRIDAFRRRTVPQGGFSVEGGLDASGLRFAVVTARFNAHVTGRLYDGCHEELTGRGAEAGDIETFEVPGCFELPLVAKELAATRRFDAVVCLGAVIRGDTPHFEYVASAAAMGVQRASMDTGVPVIFGVLTVDNEEQAMARIGETVHKGREAALTAIEMAQTMHRIRQT